MMMYRPQAVMQTLEWTVTWINLIKLEWMSKEIMQKTVGNSDYCVQQSQ